jgi:hypothetical protein
VRAWRTALAMGCALVAVAAAAQVRPGSDPQAGDPLVDAFRDPPQAARPRVWWHWVDGNISEDGIARDLAWLKRIGVAGVQNFDAALATPQVVDQRIVYMSPEWKHAFRFAVGRADALGLEYGIAASPGWSETGGPWVKPEDGMKKLVWSETVVAGGRRFTGILPLPPAVAGPYQAIVRPPEHGFQGPDLYRDTVVLAWRQPDAALVAPPVAVTVNGTAIDAAPLFDGRAEGQAHGGIALPTGKAGTIQFDYGRPQTIRSLVLHIADLPQRSFAGPLAPRIEASDDGQAWRKVADIMLTALPTTASFAPVTARRFRVVFARGPRPDTSSYAVTPGADLSAMGSIGGASTAEPRLVDLRLSGETRVNAFEQKAGFVLANDYYALDGSVGDDAAGIAPADVVDLTGRIDAAGHLDWTPPAGRWRVLRLGYSLTGKANAPATAESTGLEVDKYDAAAVGRYLDHYFTMYRDTVGADLFGRRGLTTLVTDSTEVGPSNWTPALREQFRRLRGYDPLPWLPALTGTIVGSRSRSDAFLYDYRRTLADLTTSEHYATVAKAARAQGLTVYGESLEGNRFISTLGDDLDMRSHADVPMAAMWAFGKKPGSALVADMRGAASVAHFYGRPYVAAESLTSVLNPWAHAPGDLQPMIDAEFVNGINRPFLHSVVHQPLEDKQPGLTLSAFGQYLNRHETWAEMARPWIDYIARNSLMLEQGRNVADVAFFYGEEAPIGVQADAGYPAEVPTRYAYDFVSAAMLGVMTGERGDLVSPGGARYRALYLGGTSRMMTLATLRKIAALADGGALIVGDAPTGSPGLADDRAEYDALVKRLWGGGRIVPGKGIEAALAARGIAPDFDTPRADGRDIPFVHRRTADCDLYYVANRSGRAETVEARFAVSGKAAEFWHADSGTAEAASYRIDGDATIVPLDLRAGESLFVLFRTPATVPARTIARPVETVLTTLAGPWDVAFQPGRGAPAGTRLEKLASLTEQADPGIRYFSGVASYVSDVTLARAPAKGASLWLDLGKVGDVAEVRVNGRLAGIAWKAPYRIDIGALARRGRNRVEVRVANLWVNRLIGDKQPGAIKVAQVYLPTYTAKAPLRPSGLIGPVTIGMSAP